MPTFQSSPYEHGLAEATGVLLVNLGTPDAPTPAAVRRFLAEFLWDPRVVEIPRALWWLVLHGVILRIRPARSARAYQKIWTDDGSPLLLYSQEIARAVGDKINAGAAGDIHVTLGMSYGQPSISSALDALHEAGVRRLIVLPLYPQYSGTTTASVFDAVTAQLSQRRWVPELRFISSYHDAHGYIEAVANSVREYRDAHGKGEMLLFSFHGVPKQTLLDGDPYHCQCQKTARLVAESLGLPENEWAVTFQSRVGRAEWLRPYTDETIEQFGKQAMRSLDVVCPGFSTDCLETLEEIAMQNAEIFAEAGGGALNYIPALNASDDHVAFLSELIRDNLGGWPDAAADDIASDRERSRVRARQMGAAR